MAVMLRRLGGRGYQVRESAALKLRMRLFVKEPWIRHDEHCHVDFRIGK